MRDAADNVTAELLELEVKRRPGRPRKAGAMTNAERQAAYRARLKADGISTYARPGVPDLVHRHADADELEELRAELESAKAELAEAHETIDELNDELIELRKAAKEDQALIKRLQRGLSGSIQACNEMQRELEAKPNSVTPRVVTKNIPESEWPFPGEPSAR
ncbi:hypothetical protein [Cupriavidus sp. CuC1]|uniref:hypothetical protein n=1 Tax=Cupriavidus sp. CuC1 TaxID=3373131 RepID=UPI0037D49CFF